MGDIVVSMGTTKSERTNKLNILKGMSPKMKTDASYLSSRNYDLVERSGRKVDPDSIDWARVSASNFPYYVVQRPGPRNALDLTVLAALDAPFRPDNPVLVVSE